MAPALSGDVPVCFMLVANNSMVKEPKRLHCSQGFETRQNAVDTSSPGPKLVLERLELPELLRRWLSSDLW